MSTYDDGHAVGWQRWGHGPLRAWVRVVLGLVVSLTLVAGYDVARADDVITWGATPGTIAGCGWDASQAQGFSTADVAASQAVAAFNNDCTAQGVPFHITYNGLSGSPAFASGSYTAIGNFGGQGSGTFTVTGLCGGTASCVGPGGSATPPATTAASPSVLADGDVLVSSDLSVAHPNKFMAICAWCVLFGLGFNGGRTR